MRNKLLLVALLSTSISLSAQIYVSTSGTDTSSCGTSSFPCKTINYALANQTNSTDTILLNPGTYRDTIHIPDALDSVYFRPLNYAKGQIDSATILIPKVNGASQGVMFRGNQVPDLLSVAGVKLDSIIFTTGFSSINKRRGGLTWFESHDPSYLDTAFLYFEDVLIANLNTGFNSDWNQSQWHLQSFINVHVVASTISNSKADKFVYIENSTFPFWLTMEWESTIKNSDIETLQFLGGGMIENTVLDQLYCSNNYVATPIIINHSDLGTINFNPISGPTINIQNSILRNTSGSLTAQFNLVEHNILPSSLQTTGAISVSDNVLMSSVDLASLPLDNSTNGLFPGLGEGTTTALTTDKSGASRPQPANTNPDIGPFENALSSPLSCSLNVQIAPIDTICSNSSTWVYYVGQSFDSVYWSNGSINTDSVLLSPASYSLYVKDSIGCDTTLFFNVPYRDTSGINVSPCYIYCDLDSGLNRIILEVPNSFQNLQEWRLQENVFGVWTNVSSRPATDTSAWYHSGSSPFSKTHTYRVQMLDSCGVLHSQTTPIKTILLQSSLGTSGEVNLNWNLYEGTDIWYYVINRAQGASFVAIDSVGSTQTSYIDNSPPVGYTQYFITAVRLNPCGPNLFKKETSSSRFISNSVTESVIGIHENKIGQRVFPNPTADRISIDLDDPFEYVVNSMDGRLLLKGESNGTIDLSELQAGTYTVLIQEADRATEFVVQKID